MNEVDRFLLTKNVLPCHLSVTIKIDAPDFLATINLFWYCILYIMINGLYFLFISWTCHAFCTRLLQCWLDEAVLKSYVIMCLSWMGKIWFFRLLIFFPFPPFWNWKNALPRFSWFLLAKVWFLIALYYGKRTFPWKISTENTSRECFSP